VVQPLAEVPPTEVPPAPVFEDVPEPASAAETARDDDARPDEGASADDEDDFDDGPLPTRVPGQHLSHQPSAEAAFVVPDARAPVPESDPLRPYRVHEFLSRHDQGKRRGRAEIDVLDTDDVPEVGDPAPERER
jgi:hypothetical protein